EFERLEAEFTAGDLSGILATGPSATADMGATVHGVHGPSEVHVIVVTDR
ncbi:MAG: LUD domain-containing protein, partial [Halodesulfurarchaeum sp.]